ncbi:cyclopropane-fatty-acyl-phospholipid synthase family protein [Pelagibius sp. Alg239-R121]|uniref:SAM-dependent methyltransferase n=1 Tax=Pelagibius sp. Alg239-R121 TaxID=2993448 RepID=UPI0024A65B83|nr:cyclopropane-fatty-acyl-phospholipid synthase family protein [Pelagibius sp. Alg239-R121]
MPSNHGQSRLDAARRALAHVHERLELDFGFELWDGSTIPAERNGDSDLRLAITDEMALPRLLRRPKAKTLIDLHIAGDIDIRGGTLFELASRRPQGKSRVLRERLDKGLLLKAALPLAVAFKKSGGSSDKLGEGSTAGKGSDKADIAYHYDVSNDFYRLFLDKEMVYTCGYFTDWANDIDTAQRDKLDMICKKLRLKPGERLLDIGCGWGALICHAAEHYGVTALGVTLSDEQLELARKRIEERGLSDKVSVELRDFRDLEGTFDKVSSIGMFEHVGIANHASYFKTVNRLLEPRGLYLHHSIARRGKSSDAKFNKKRPEYTSMLKYIFPGAEVDHVGMSIRNLEAHGFEVHDVEAWREHYARTTRLWAERLMAKREAAIAEAGEERYRLWVLYLAGVSMAFERGTLNIFQTLASKRTRGLSGMPPTRADLYE